MVTRENLTMISSLLLLDASHIILLFHPVLSVTDCPTLSYHIDAERNEAIVYRPTRNKQYIEDMAASV